MKVWCPHLVVARAPPLSARKSLRSDHLISLHVRQHPRALRETNYTQQTTLLLLLFTPTLNVLAQRGTGLTGF